MNTTKKHKPAAREFRSWAKGRSAYLGLSLTEIAETIGRSRGAVSRAVNRGEFPRVCEEIRKALAE